MIHVAALVGTAFTVSVFQWRVQEETSEQNVKCFFAVRVWIGISLMLVLAGCCVFRGQIDLKIFWVKHVSKSLGFCVYRLLRWFTGSREAIARLITSAK